MILLASVVKVWVFLKNQHIFSIADWNNLKLPKEVKLLFWGINGELCRQNFSLFPQNVSIQMTLCYMILS